MESGAVQPAPDPCAAKATRRGTDKRRTRSLLGPCFIRIRARESDWGLSCRLAAAGATTPCPENWRLPQRRVRIMGPALLPNRVRQQTPAHHG